MNVFSEYTALLNLGDMEGVHTKTAEEVMKYFQVGPYGLTEEQVIANREKYGPNGTNFIL